MIKAFWDNLKGIIAQSPLIFSDTYSTKDVSMNRIAQAALLCAALLLIFAIYRSPDKSTQLTPVLDKVLIILGAQLAANVAKRAIDTHKAIKTAQGANMAVKNDKQEVG